MTDYEILSLAHRTCWKYKCGSDNKNKKDGETYTFDQRTLLEFVRLLKLMENPHGNA